jgi:hypothetical protein
MSDLALEQLVDRAKDICAYAFRARILHAKFSQESHEDYQFINLILPQVAGQKYIAAKDMDGYYNWGKSFFAQQMQWLNSEEVKIVESGGPVRCLCVKCGEIKMNITKRCPRCGFLPTEMKDIFHTYTLRIESVRFSEPEESPYWVKMRYLKSLGENIDKAISNLYSDKEYAKQYDNFAQNEGKFLHQLIHFGGSKDEIANIMNYLRPSKKPNLKEKLRNYFKI